MCLNHVYIYLEPIGSACLTFDDDLYYELCVLVTEVCSESRMRSRTSRGGPEWSGGKDLYMGSHHTVTGIIRGVTDIVPGPAKGLRGPPGGPYGLCVERDQPLSGLGASPLGPMRLGFRGNPKGGASLPWGARQPPLAAAPSSDWI